MNIKIYKNTVGGTCYRLRVPNKSYEMIIRPPSEPRILFTAELGPNDFETNWLDLLITTGLTQAQVQKIFAAKLNFYETI